jgi:hypothetical protein
MSFEAEYGQFHKITEIMPVHPTGILTARDGFAIDFTDEPLRHRMQIFTDKGLSDNAVADRLGISENYAWRIAEARRSLRSAKKPQDAIRNLYYRPFDVRRVIFHPAVVWRPRMEVMRHLLGGRKNMALVTSRMTKGEEFAHAMVSRDIVEVIAISSKTSNNAFVFPLFLAGEEESGQGRLSESVSEPNFSPQFLRILAQRLGAPTLEPYGLPGGVTPQEIGYFVYAVLYCPSYRARYAEFLKIDFPRLPLTSNLELFRSLASLGGQLVAVHLLESLKLDHPITEYLGGRAHEVERVSWSKNTVWLNKTQTTGFRGVREEVWNFHIGGYQVCQKWLKDRRGRTLSKDDIIHYQKIVVAVAETIRLMKEIDAVIGKHGGWPAAFASSSTAASKGTTANKASLESVVPIHGEAQHQEERYQVEAPFLRKAAQPPSPLYKQQSTTLKDESASAPTEDLDRDELICQIRQFFMDGTVHDREAAIRELARELRYQRTSPRIHQALNDTIRTAVRRGILGNVGGDLKIAARSIEQYEREFLKQQFLASLGGSAWIEREDAIRAFARWLGFRRTGPTIDETARSLINGLIREGRLESDATQVRKVR